MMQAEWIQGLAGGLLIGLAGAMFLLVNGRILGPSGILGGLVDGTGGDNRDERFAFITGLAVVPAILAFVAGGASTHITGNMSVIVVAGLLVGIGTRLANGCTGGHGVCGIARLSPRGIVATGVFILGGAVSVYLFRHVWEII